MAAHQPEVQRLEWIVNEWGHKEYFRKGNHMSIDDLKRIHSNQYFHKPVAEPNIAPENYNTVPHYPRPVEFHVSKIAHVTCEEGVDGIMRDDGFRRGKTNFLWWGLVIGADEIKDAEQRYLQKHFPNRTPEEEAEQRERPFLEKFTTSPVFQNDESRYGNFRFTFSLADVLQAYRTKICGKKRPVLRVYKTSVYRQEVMYVVVVHSPDVHDYDDYPVLGDNDDGVCAYRDGKIIWRAQAISETHKFRLKVQENQVDVEDWYEEYYVWDHVTLAFHMPDENAVLEFPREELLEALTACESAAVQVDRTRPRLTREEADEIVHNYKQCWGVTSYM